MKSKKNNKVLAFKTFLQDLKETKTTFLKANLIVIKPLNL
jgi:hypothetical protein